AMAVVMRRRSSGDTGCPGSVWTMPAMPHMSAGPPHIAPPRQIGVELTIPLGHALETEVLDRPLPAGLAVYGAEVRLPHVPGEGPRVADGHQPAGHAVLDQLGIAARPRRHQWQAARHRLQHGVRDTLRDRG